MSGPLKVILGVLILIIVGIQFIPSDLPPVSNENKNDLISNARMDDDIHLILKTSCYDCHSNETRYPWYSYVAPAKWLVIKDINEGRKELNFSEWQLLNKRDQLKYLNDIAEEVEGEMMPLPIYTAIHRKAILDDEKKEKLINWTTQYSNQILGE